MSEAFPEPQTADVPPDHTQSPQPETERRSRPSRGISLGQNKRARSGVRKLTDDDRHKLENWYTGIAFMLAPIRKNVSLAIADNTDQCVDAWMELADENDRIRRFLLAMIEGSAWSKLIGAHMPILFAAIPPEMWERMPGLAGLRPHPDSEEGTAE